MLRVVEVIDQERAHYLSIQYQKVNTKYAVFKNIFVHT